MGLELFRAALGLGCLELVLGWFVGGLGGVKGCYSAIGLGSFFRVGIGGI